MSDLKIVKSKIQSVTSIRKITKAMELVSRSKMKKAIDSALSMRPFSFFAIDLLSRISNFENVSHPFFKEVDSEKVLIIEISANKGLCGGYNSNVFRELKKTIALYGLENVDLCSIGKYSKEHARILRITPVFTLENYKENILPENFAVLYDFVEDAYLSGKYRKILLVSTHYESTLSQKAKTMQILPINKAQIESQLGMLGGKDDKAIIKHEREIQYIIEPSLEEVESNIIPKIIKAELFEQFSDAQASEQAARMIAMKNATENADELKSSLTLSYNNLRQQNITRELSEIVAGSESLNS